MRSEYQGAGLDEDTAREFGPLSLFGQWIDDAIHAQVPEPNAMALATATADGTPSVRIVLMKSLDKNGVVFFTGYESRKGHELQENPRAAAVMLWHPIRRQVRIEGRVERVSAAESDAYFASRPRGAQISATASPQSQVVDGRAELNRRRAAVEEQFFDGDIERPVTWGGYRLSLDTMEFWQGATDRFHDRIRFTATPTGWTLDRLAP